MNAAVVQRAISPAIEQLFVDLANERLFVIYRLIPREGGRTDKVPVDANGQPVDAHDAANRMLPGEAVLWYQLGTGDGIGIVITPESRLWFLDLDHCREGNGWAPHVAAFLDRFPGCYRETSASGQGRHALGRYSRELPDHRTRNADYRLELYTGARFCALTGADASGSILTDCTDTLLHVLAAYFPPREAEGSAEWTEGPCAGWRGPADDGELIRRAMQSTSAHATWGRGASFAALWQADADVLGRAYPPQSAGQPYDASAADLAIANMLAWWTGNHAERIERLMLGSALRRSKWETRPGYLRGTILRACASQTDWYNGPGDPEPASAPAAASAPTAIVVAEQSAGAVAGLAPVPPAVMANLTVNGKAQAEASLPNLVKILAAQTTGRIGFDTFRGGIMIELAPGQWRRVTDDDMTEMREKLERVDRFAAIGKDMFRDALSMVAKRHQFDSAIVWLEQQQWDGTLRVDRFLHDFCGCPLDDYTIAVSRYIWSGLASRIYEPGCQLDMVVAMLSKEQGFHKSSALAEMVPDPEFFTDALDLHKDTDDFKRMIRGKLVCEIAEMVGLNVATVEHVKRVITRRVEEWVEKWQTMSTRYARRCMLFATTNNEQFLPLDETGQRRWLPIEIGRIDRELLKAMRGHLWAEGANIYRMRKDLGLPGVEFETAEQLAKGRHAKHEQSDVWETLISQWLATPIGGPNSEILPAPGTRPFTMAEVLAGALLMNKDRMDGKAEKRTGRILTQLGYSRSRMRVAAVRGWYWQRGKTGDTGDTGDTDGV